MIRTIPERDWPAFLAAFSHAHQGWLVTVHGASADEHVDHCRDALRHVTIEGTGMARAVTIELTNEARVYVAHPRDIRVQQSGDGLETALEIENASGVVTRLGFHAAASPEPVGDVTHREHHAPGLVNLLARTVLAAAAIVFVAQTAASAVAQHRRPPPRAPAPAARVAVRGELIFIGGYFYDPFTAPYPWWPHPGYPGWYFPRYDYRAEVRVSSTPKDASVYVDGFYAGIVDDFDGIFQRLLVPPGGHHLALYRDGYRTAEFDLYLQPGTSVKVHHAMERLAAGDRSIAPAVAAPVPRPPDGSYRLPRTPPPTAMPSPPLPQHFGNIDIRVQPADAAVRIDGNPALTSEAGHFVIAVGEGGHHVEVARAGYVRYETTIDVAGNTTSMLNVMLPLDDSKGRR